MGVGNKHFYSFPKGHMLSCDLSVSLSFHLVNWFEEHFLVTSYPGLLVVISSANAS